jgi:hypothetical protein
VNVALCADLDVIDQPQLVDVHWNFWIEYGAKDANDFLTDLLHLCSAQFFTHDFMYT